jgi:chitosanase
MLTRTEAATAQAIVNIFETGAVRGRPGQVTVIPGDSGHLSFGRSQTTLGSGNLHKLLARYCAHPGARFGSRLLPHLDRFEARDLSLDIDQPVHNLLRATADDPVMRDIQDAFFEEVYWAPALRSAGTVGITTPLGVAVVYDSTVHGSWDAMLERTIDERGTLDSLGEAAWVAAYAQVRRHWLANHSRDDLRLTVYRMDAFLSLIDQGCWSLDLPLVVCNLEISTASLQAMPPDCWAGPEPGSRTLAVQSPLARGLDVRLVQLGLSDRGFAIKADGIFGRASSGCIRSFQASIGRHPTGVADPELIDLLTA